MHSGKMARRLRQIQRAERKVILARYARLSKTERPEVCSPSPSERVRHSDRKVIFDSEESAKIAAAALVLLGARRMRAYPCPRSKRGHWHLSTERPDDVA